MNNILRSLNKYDQNSTKQSDITRKQCFKVQVKTIKFRFDVLFFISILIRIASNENICFFNWKKVNVQVKY